MMKLRHGLAWIAPALAACALALACGNSPTGPSGDCGGGLVFSVLPVPIGAIDAATPIGNMGPPVHTIPTDHAGFYLFGTGITLSAPAALRITTVRTTRYLASPFRGGQSDYAITANLCQGFQLSLGHIQTVVAKIQSQAGGSCSTYSTADETVQACRNDGADISMAAGETIGTVGGASAGAFDFGLYQPGHQNFFVNPGRYSSLTLEAVCPYDPFTPDLRNQINPRIGAPGQPASGEPPLCGTMSVDVAGTARGVWVLQSDPVNQAGDETNFAALAPHPLYPQSAQTFSLGPAAIVGFGPTIARYPVMTSGRVNRQFSDVTADGQVYCYFSDVPGVRFSYFVQLDSGGVLTIQKVTHSPGGTPCTADASTWVLNGSGLRFIR